MNVRRHAIVALLAVAGPIGLVSCGSSDPAVLALVGSGQESARNGASASLTMGGSADAKMAPFANIEYKVIGDLPNLGESGRAWTLERLSAKTAVARLEKVAAALGVEGDVLADKKDKSAYTIGADTKSGTGMWLYVGESESYWSYNSMSYATIKSPASCTKSPDGTESCSESGEAPAPPKNLASKSEALASVRTFVSGAGENVDDFVMTATSDDWSTNVQATLKLGGVATSYAWWFSFGEDGALTGASGQFIQPAKADKYPLVNPASAIDRMTSPMFAMRGVGVAGGSGVDAVSSAPVAGDEVAEGEVEARVDPSVANTTPPVPETITINITDVRLTLMTAYLAEGRVMLLPAYTFSNVDGDVGTVFAVADKYLQTTTPDTVVDEPTPDTVVVEPDPGASGSSSAAGGGGTSGAVDPAPPGDDVLASSVDVKTVTAELVGLAEDEAMKVAAANGWTVRVASRDGEEMMLTADYSPDRVNLTVLSGKVTSVSLG